MFKMMEKIVQKLLLEAIWHQSLVLGSQFTQEL